MFQISEDGAQKTVYCPFYEKTLRTIILFTAQEKHLYEI